MSTSLNSQTRAVNIGPFADSRTQGYQGPSRYVRLSRAAPAGSASMAKSEDGTRCAIAGKESLRIATIPNAHNQDPESPKISRNFWDNRDNNGLKIDSAVTDIAWGHGSLNNKIVTCARNGEITLWSLHPSGNIKYERRTRGNLRAMNAIAVSPVVHYYCITGSAEDMKVWDLRDLTKYVMRVSVNSATVRSLVFSPSVWQPLQCVFGLDNGSIQRWDLKNGNRGLMDRVAVAHSAPITSLDWRSTPGAAWSAHDKTNNGAGWLVSGGLDRCVKIWDLASPSANARMSTKSAYTLHPSFPVRHVSWRPGYECEVAVVSNEEVSFPSADTQSANVPGALPGLLSRVGSGLGLDAMMRGLQSDPHTIPPGGNHTKPQGPAPQDSIEIWDVRRGWLAKWSVTGSSLEGSINDIAFGDSHALWAQHASGAFSQFDLRETSKPIDALNRVSTAWDPNGTVAFIADNNGLLEPPYDDITQINPSNSPDVSVSPNKSLGDPPIKVASQVLGIFVPDVASGDCETFTLLAHNYVFQGADKHSICDSNAQIALQAGRTSAFQMWSLMATAFTDFIPPASATPAAGHSPHINKRMSLNGEQQGLSGNFMLPSPGNETLPRRSPGQSTRNVTRTSSKSRSVSATRRLTPTSSNSSSPLHLSNGLPPLTPNRALFDRRDSVDSGIARSRASNFRRPSLSGQVYASSPWERSGTSLRHVGEGALDSSSSEGEQEVETVGSEDFFGGSLRAANSPIQALGTQVAVPSPLSRVIGQQQWAEDVDAINRDDDDDDEASSPSPRSTDTESDHSSNSWREAKSRSRRHPRRIKSRSRSSTLASLAAPPQLGHRPSRSSMRTVIATDTSVKEFGDHSQIRMDNNTVESSGHKHQKSHAFSELPLDAEPTNDVIGAHSNQTQESSSKRRIEVIRAEEKRFRESAWEVAKDAIEKFAEEGDVQICAMVSLIAREELRIPLKRVYRFVEAYIERLTQYQLYTCAALIRKFCNLEDIGSHSLKDTVFYTTCGKCNKPLLKSAVLAALPSEYARPGAYSYCFACQMNTVRCSICRLPVRSLLFQCSVCKHGGHQSCYRQFYLQHPMVELPATAIGSNHSEDRGRTLSRQNERAAGDESVSGTRERILDDSVGEVESPARTDVSQRLMGHPCAAGCGHYCWAANTVLE